MNKINIIKVIAYTKEGDNIPLEKIDLTKTYKIFFDKQTITLFVFEV